MAELTQEQIFTLSRRLEERAAALRSSFQDHLVQLRDTSAPGHDATPPGDIADQADIERKRDEQNDAMTRATREMLDIAAAFERLSAGQANVCAECGEPIGFERLLVQPTAVRCVPCQSSSERDESMQARGARDQALSGPTR